MNITKYTDTYNSVADWFNLHPWRTRALLALNRILTFIGYIAYPLLLVLEAIYDPTLLLRSIIVPAVGFAICTIIRSAVDSPRPYEVAPIEPLIKKDTRGHSFPSRHTFCMFMIAGSWLIFFKPMAFALLAFGCIMAATRVLGGVHFAKDVVCGALLALVWGHVCYIMLPIW